MRIHLCMAWASKDFVLCMKKTLIIFFKDVQEVLHRFAFLQQGSFLSLHFDNGLAGRVVARGPPVAHACFICMKKTLFIFFKDVQEVLHRFAFLQQGSFLSLHFDNY